MDNSERVMQLAKMLLELRMCGTLGEAERRAKEIIASDGGPPLSTARSLPDVGDVSTEPAPEAAQTQEGTVPEVANVTEVSARKGISAFEEMHKALADMQTEPSIELQQVEPAPAPEPISEIESVTQDLDKLKEDETKEELNERDLEAEMQQLMRELENSRKEVEMLRTKLTKTEEMLAKAQQASVVSDRTLMQPESRPAPQNHEKPRGTNPAIDLSKVFGRR